MLECWRDEHHESHLPFPKQLTALPPCPLTQAHLPPPGPGTLTLRCGPPPMMDTMKRVLDGVGYTEDMQFQF